MRLAFVGYGEVAHFFTLGLVEAGWPADGISAYYPRQRARFAEVRSKAAEAGIRVVGTPAELTGAADLVISAVQPTTALDAAEDTLPHLAPGTIYADINSTSPDAKRTMASLAAARGIVFVDVALNGAAAIFRHRALLQASGPGAEAFRGALEPYGGNVELLGPEPGAAAQFKMLRSTAIKGFAMLMAETLVAARTAGLEEAILTELSRTMATLPFERHVERWLTGSVEHAARRVGEMDYVQETLQALHVRPQMTGATRTALARLAETGPAKPANWRESLEHLALAWALTPGGAKQ